MNPNTSEHPFEKRIRRNLRGPKQRFRAVCHPGFETITAREIMFIGVSPEKVSLSKGAVDFEAKLSEVWKIHAYTRTITRILMRITSFKAENFGRLKKEFQKIPWELYLPSFTSPKILITSHTSRLYHSGAVEEQIRPIIEEKIAFSLKESLLIEPQSVYLFFENNICLVSIDLSGELLYKRGFSKFTEKAPLRETLAASILLSAGIQESKTLLDPMAGSGTFSLEAAFLASRKIPGTCRKFAFMDQPAFSPQTWNFILKNIPEALNIPLETIYAADKDSKAYKTILHNIQAAQFENQIEAERSDFFSLSADRFSKPLLWVLNPPYGKRIPADTVSLYKEIGRKIRSDFSKDSGALICPNSFCKKALNFPEKKSIRTVNGGIPVEILFF